MRKMVIGIAAVLCVATMISGCANKNKTAGTEYVTLGDYKELDITLDSYEVTDEKLKNFVEEQISYTPSYKKIDKDTVEDGDYVDINFEGIMDGEAFEGGSSDNYVLEIGSKSFFEGFEEGLVGAKVGDEPVLELQFPDDYWSEEFQGKPVVFNTKINAIVEKEDIGYDTLTDEYIKENMGVETVDEFLEQAKSQLEQTLSSSKEQDLIAAVIEKLKEVNEVKDIPDEFVEEKSDEYMQQFKYMVEKKYDMELKEFLETSYQMTEEDFRADTVNFVRENLVIELILAAIADNEKIKVDEEGYNEYVTLSKADYGYETDEELYGQFTKEHLQQKYREKKAMDLVVDNAKITYAESSAVDELLPEEEPTDENADTPDEEPTDENADTPDEEPTDENADTPEEEPTDENADTPEEEPTDENADTPDEEPTDENVDENGEVVE